MAAYPSFKTLSLHETPERDYRIRMKVGRTAVAVMAIHGGDIEPGTTEIAEAIAGREHAFYTFSGIKPFGNRGLHITSHRFDEPRAIRLALDSDIVLAVHGCKGGEERVIIGGRNLQLIGRIETSLAKAAFQAEASDRFPGRHSDNICNRCKSGAGVQLEIFSGLRRRMLGDLARPRRKKAHPEFYRFVTAVRGALTDRA